MKTEYTTAIVDCPDGEINVYTSYNSFTSRGRLYMGNAFLALTKILLEHGFDASTLELMVNYAKDHMDDHA